METRTYTILATENLIQWNKNKSKVTPENLELLKEKLQKKDQFRPLLVTPHDSLEDTFIVLAGNKRLLGWKALGVPLIDAIVIFFINQNNMWYAIINGKQQSEAFATKEAAMLDWSLTDNEYFGSYDQAELKDDADSFGLDWSSYIIPTEKPVTLKGKMGEFLMKDDTDEEEKVNKSTKITKHRCPMCGNEFED